MKEDVAIVVEKITLDQDHFLLLPKAYIEGNYINDNDGFYTHTGQHYASVKNGNDIRSSETTFFAYPINMEELRQIYPDIENKYECIGNYYNFISEYVYIGVVDDKTNTVSLYNFELSKDMPKKTSLPLTEEAILSLMSSNDIEEIKKRLFMSLLEGKGQKEEKKKAKKEVPATNKHAPRRTIKNIDADDLERYLKERIFGQDDEIEDIVTVLCMNYKTDRPKEIKTMLIIGPTGCGKTETFQVIGEYLDIPTVIYDMTQLSQVGYVGQDISSILLNLYNKAQGDLEKAQNGLLVLDEFDKIAQRGSTVSDIAVQQELLKLLDGTTYNLEIGRGKYIDFDTRYLNIVATGAFQEMFERKKNTIGFQEQSGINKKEKITSEDIIGYGMIKELVGRFDLFLIFNYLDYETRLRILKDSKISPTRIKQEQLQRNYGVFLRLPDSYYEKIIEDSMNPDTGIRGIKSAVEKSLLKAQGMVVRRNGVYSEIVVDNETVTNNHHYQLVKKSG